jgi:LemA protein
LKKLTSKLGVVGIAIVVGILYLVSFYNGLVGKSQGIDGQWAQVETQYQRRFDLIPNLVESVEGIFTQEQEVFGDIAEARTRYSGAATVDDKAAAAGELESALGRLLVVVENYPDLRSNESVQQLMDDLSGTENRISVERRRFNDQVRDYNTVIKRVPGNMLAPMFGFSDRAYFESAEGAEAAPRVQFDQ